MTNVAGSINFSGVSSALKLSTTVTPEPSNTTHHFSTKENNIELFHISIERGLVHWHETSSYLIISIGSTNDELLNLVTQKINQDHLVTFRKDIPCSMIYINKEKKQCFLITDVLGSYPFYYCLFNNTLLFASKQRLLIEQIPREWKLNKHVLFELLHMGMVTPPDTLISELYSLPVTQYLEYTQTVKRHDFYFEVPDYQAISYTKIRDRIIDGFQDTTVKLDPLNIMCSGGLDSSALVALASGFLNKKINLHTCLQSKSSSDYLQTKILQQYFQTKNSYYLISPRTLYSQIDASILAGESEVVGVLSVNAALEYLFAHMLLQGTSTIMTGDDNSITPCSIFKQTPGYYHLKYGLVTQLQSKQLLLNYTESLLAYINKSTLNFIKPYDYHTVASQRLLIHATMIGKIIAKYRMGLNPAQRCIMPLNTSFYRNYIDSLNYHHGSSGFEYRNAIKKMVNDNTPLDEHFFNQPKRWMPSMWEQPSGECFIKKMIQMLTQKDPLSSQIINLSFLEELLKSNNRSDHIPLITALFYLQRFCILFKLKV